MKFRQLSKYNMEKMFLKNHGQTSSRKLVLALLKNIYKKSKLSITLDQLCDVIQFVVIGCRSGVLPKYIEIKVLITYYDTF